MADTKDADVNLRELRPQFIKMALELGPTLVFYLGFLFGGRIIAAFPQLSAAGFDDPLYPATLVFMVAMVVSLGVSLALFRRVAVMPVVTFAVVLIFGGLTFIYHDTTFAKMKPTVVNALFGAILLGGLAFRQSLLRYVFGEVYKLQPKGWTILTWRWGLFFFVLAFLNEVVWRTQTADVWVAYKFWGTMPLTVVFAALQLPVLTRYAPDHQVHEVVPPMDPLP